ncbi:MAG: YgiT-type zinc finger protein [Oscillatoriales cyanobacterium]|nr:MAG: YgiT-type zinc finger protein [Oscillatoriales cyanobacterium]
MREIRCNTCDSNRYEERKINYLYSYQGKYLLVPNTPVEICLDCGMIYYDAAVLIHIFKFRARVTRKKLFFNGQTGMLLKSRFLSRI